MKTLMKIYRYVTNGEWVVFITVAEALIVAVAELTDVMPDGDAKLAVIGVLASLGALAARARVWSSRSMDRVT